MATYSSRLRLVKQDTNENVNTWGAILNTQGLDMVDEAIAGVETVAVTGGTTTLTTSNGTTDVPRNAVLVFSGALTADQTVNVPATEKTWMVFNNTTGTYRLTIKTAAGTGVEIPQGAGRKIYCDGTNVNAADIPANEMFTPIPGAPTRTGNTTFTMTGDQTLLAPINTMLRIDHSIGVHIERVTAISFSAGTTTFTVTTVNGNLPSDLRRINAAHRGDRQVLSAAQVRDAVSTTGSYTITGNQTISGNMTVTGITTTATLSVTGVTTFGSYFQPAASANFTPAATLPAIQTTNIANFTGATPTVSAVNASTPNVWFARWNGGVTLTNNATLKLPGGANYVTTDGDMMVAFKVGTEWEFMLMPVNGFALKERFGSLYAKLSEVQAAGTNGGTFTSGSFVKRTLNTEVDPAGIVALASSVFTLGTAGTYYIKASAPAYDVDSHVCKIRNTSDATDALIGTAEAISGGATSRSFVEGQITIAGSKNFELQHRCQTTNTDNGLGQPANLGVSEVYSVVEIWRIA